MSSHVEISPIIPRSRIISDAAVCVDNPLNYAPVLSDVHTLVQGHSYGVVDSEYFVPYGTTARVSITHNTIEPSDGSKGRIARHWIYMQSEGCVKLSDVESDTYSMWANGTVYEAEFELQVFAKSIGVLNKLIYDNAVHVKHGDLCMTVINTKCMGKPFGGLPVCTKRLETDGVKCKHET